MTAAKHEAKCRAWRKKELTAMKRGAWPEAEEASRQADACLTAATFARARAFLELSKTYA